MLAQLQSEKRNLESSLLFMQQEHSSTLKALHEEIGSLQKKCTELTFQLTMQGLEDIDTNKQDYESKLASLESCLEESRSKHAAAEQELKKKDEVVKELRLLLKSNEKMYLEELKSKRSQVLALRVELDSKSSTIATLTTDLHRLKVRTRTEGPLQSADSAAPQRVKSSKKPSRLSSASSAGIQSRPVTAKSAKTAPDAALFLATTPPTEPKREVNMKPTPPVLPPIAGPANPSGRRQQLIRRRLELKAQPELYRTLAVDQLASGSKNRIHETDASTK